jgi:hypothetical protein
MTGPPPETWRPDKPELVHPNPLVGVLEWIVAPRDFGWGPTNGAVLRIVDGTTWCIWLMGTVLKQEFDQDAPGTPRPGDLVAVFYEGRKRKKSAPAHDQSPSAFYESYRVVVDQAPAAQPTATQLEPLSR